MLKIFSILSLFLIISACSTKSGHTPDAFAIIAPIAKPINKITSKVHQRKFTKVSQYLGNNYEAIENEIGTGSGEHFTKLILLINNNASNTLTYQQKIHQKKDYIFNNSREVVMRLDAIVSQLVPAYQHSSFPFKTRISLLKEIQANYPAYRLAVKNKDINRLQKTAELLSIPQHLQQAFFNKLFSQYHSIFIDTSATKVFWAIR